jgi:hypothetical protein
MGASCCLFVSLLFAWAALNFVERQIGTISIANQREPTCNSDEIVGQQRLAFERLWPINAGATACPHVV